MSTSLSRYLRLKIDSNLTANSKYNLERLDLLGSTFIVDSTDQLDIRSKSSIFLEPNSADIGGTGSGGTVSIGSASNDIDTFNVYADQMLFSGSFGFLDQATSGTKYLHLQYNSTLNGSVDTSADRTLSIDVDGADRSFILGGNYSQTGGNLALTLGGATALTLPTSGTLASLAGSEVFTNKTIDASLNTLLNIPGSAISSSASIAYSKLSLTNSIVNADVNTSAAIAGTKIAPNFGSQTVATTGSLSLSNGSFASSFSASGSQAAGIAYILPTTAPVANQILVSNSSNPLQLQWGSVAGTGSVTSVDVSVPAGLLTSSGGPITSAGTIALALASQNANRIFSGPSTGSAAAPSFRALVLADLPSAIPYSQLSLTGTILNADIASGAGIVYSKLNLSNSIVNADIVSAAGIPYSKLSLTNSILNADVSSSAAIAYSKLNLATSIVNADVSASAAIAYSKLALTGSIVNADVNASAAIAYSKLNLSTSIVNADINASAAIAYSKLNLSASIVNADIASAAAIAVNKLAALTVSRAVVTDSSGFISAATTTAAEIGFVNGVTSAIQTQLNVKLAATSIVSVSSNVSLTNKAIHLVDTSGNRSLTLPAPSTTSFIVVKDSTGSAATHAITIVRNGSEKIETVAASYSLSTNLGSWTFISDGTDWFII